MIKGIPIFLKTNTLYCVSNISFVYFYTVVKIKVF